MKPRSKTEYRVRRHLRVRQKVRGTAECPRMCVHVSNKHLRVQFVDDDRAATLASITTMTPGLREKTGGKLNVGVAKEVGTWAAKVAQEKGIRAVVFDRGGFAYRGRVKALADAAREGGLKF